MSWARRARAPLTTVSPDSPSDDLRPLGGMIDGARLVGFGEGVHAGSEPLEFRNRILRYLVEQKHFTAIAVESGLVEGRVVYGYVRGGPGTLKTVVRDGLSWTFDAFPQNGVLIQWLRLYNEDPRHQRKINFYGFDICGSPGNPNPQRGPQTALLEVLQYLARVDPPAANALQARLKNRLADLRFDFGKTTGYESLDQADRDDITAVISDLISLLERKEAEFVGASSQADYSWAYRTAIVARQTDEFLRQIPLGWHAAADSERPDYRGESMRFLAVAQDVRDRAQADNIEWIAQQEGPQGRILVFAHRYHLSAAPVITSWTGPRGHERVLQQPAGTYLKRRFGREYLVFGNLIGKGRVACSGYSQLLDPRDSFDALAGQVGTPQFLLDLHQAPARVASWLDEEHTLGQADDEFEVALGRAFDGIVYFDRITPACGG